MDKHIYIVGFMGSGKSTMGPVLASKMDRPFYDLDDLIEEEQERTISEIFESQGEEHFRKLESATPWLKINRQSPVSWLLEEEPS